MRRFTLIELLIVIAIIGILISILLPSLSQARVKAFQSVSASNLKQIGGALVAYSAKNNGRLPPSKRYKPNGNKENFWFQVVNEYLNVEIGDKIWVQPGTDFSSTAQRTYSATAVILGDRVNKGDIFLQSRFLQKFTMPQECFFLFEGKLKGAEKNTISTISWDKAENDKAALYPANMKFLHFYHNNMTTLKLDLSIEFLKVGQINKINIDTWTGL